MQECFRAHPDHYGDELNGDDDTDEMDEEPHSKTGQAGSGTKEASASAPPSSQISTLSHVLAKSENSDEPPEAMQGKAATEKTTAQRPESKTETDELVPKAWHDTTEKNKPS